MKIPGDGQGFLMGNECGNISQGENEENSMRLKCEAGTDVFELIGGKVESFAILPVVVLRHEMDVSMGDVGADDFPEGAAAGDVFHVAGEFLGGGHEGLIVFVF